MKNKISYIELYSLVFFINMPTAMIIGIGKELYQDVWIGIAFSGLFCLIMLLFYGILIKRYPQQSFGSIILSIFGKKLGMVIVLIYSLYFIYIGFRVFEDLFFFVNIIFLPFTPKLPVYIFAIPIFVYSVMLGAKKVASLASLVFVISIGLFVFFRLITLINVLDRDIAHLSCLTPVLEIPLKDIVIWSSTNFTVLFGEIIAVLAFFSNMKNTNKSYKMLIFTIIINTIFLAFTISYTIMIINPAIYSNSTFMVIQFSEIIAFGMFIKIDFLLMLSALFYLFMKVIIFYTAAVETAGEVLKFNRKYIVALYGIILFIAGMMNEEDYIKHMDIGFKFVVKYIHIPIQIVIPGLMVIIVLTKKLLKKDKKLIK